MADDALSPLRGSREFSREFSGEFSLDPAVFARWRAADPVAGAQEDLTEDGAVDPMALAAYLDGRADPAEQVLVEAALQRDPALLDFLIEQRHGPITAEIPSPALLAAAKALVPDSVEILAFRPVAFRRGWRRFVPMSAMAASVALVALAGFNIGLQAQEHLAPTATSPDMFDPPTLLQDNELG